MEMNFIDLEPVEKAVEDTFADFLDAVRQRITKTVTTTVRSISRTLMGLDEIQRLERPATSTTTKITNTYSGTALELAELAKQSQIAEKAIRNIHSTAGQVNFTPAVSAFSGLGKAAGSVASVINTSLAQASSGVLGPLGVWRLDGAGESSLNSFSGSLGQVSAAMGPVHSALGGTGPLTRAAGEAIGALNATTLSAAGSIGAAGSAVAGTMSALSGSFAATQALGGSAMAGLTGHVSAMAAAARECLGGLGSFLTGAFTGNWQEAFLGLKTMVRGGANTVIGAVNAMLSGLVGGLNSLINLLNKLKIDIPSWVPLLGGKRLGFNLKPMTAPQIPYLAQGAVLPANKPFLAVVGDQKHGTNIEAPLATIQQAVEQTMAGANAQTVALLGEILQAILGIRIGDEVIAAAVSRHSARLAVVKGG